MNSIRILHMIGWLAQSEYCELWYTDTMSSTLDILQSYFIFTSYSFYCLLVNFSVGVRAADSIDSTGSLLCFGAHYIIYCVYCIISYFIN